MLRKKTSKSMAENTNTRTVEGNHVYKMKMYIAFYSSWYHETTPPWYFPSHFISTARYLFPSSLSLNKCCSWVVNTIYVSPSISGIRRRDMVEVRHAGWRGSVSPCESLKYYYSCAILYCVCECVGTNLFIIYNLNIFQWNFKKKIFFFQI